MSTIAKERSLVCLFWLSNLLTIPDVLHRNHGRRPGSSAVVDDNRRLNQRELVERSWSVANGLARLGVRPGDTVAILCGNGIFSAETILGAIAAGAVAVPLSWRWSPAELEHGLSDSRAKVVLADREFAGDVQDLIDGGKAPAVAHLVTDGPDFEAFLGPPSTPDVAVVPSSPAVMLYTGGTTGDSKGVLLSHTNVMANAIDEIVDTDMEADDVTLLIAPMYHSASLLCWFLPHLVIGACSIFMRRFDEEQAAGLIEREHVTNGFFIPNMVRRMLISGAWERHDMGSIGQEMLLNDVSIQDDDGREVADGVAGEICVRGPNVMLGYFNRPDATAEAFRNGWLRTGDVASRRDGYFMFHDRLKDMIKTGGENVFSAEVEQALYSHPSVAEAAVFGVTSEKWDEEVRAVVALKPGVLLAEAELQNHCRGRLAGYKVPKRIAFVALETIPVNPSGQIMKRELKQQKLWPDMTPAP